MPAVRTLVIDDNRDSADTLAMYLRLLNFPVEVAYNGADGVRTAVGWKPHVVLCDVVLPDVSVYEVARQLRHNPATAGARLVAITGHGPDILPRAIESGFENCYPKPVDLMRLLAHFPAYPNSDDQDDEPAPN